MTDFPDLKIKALVSFPATIIDGVGIDTVKQNGGYQFNLAFDDFAPPVSSVTDPANQNALLWNAITKQYVLAPVSILSSTVSPSTTIPLPNATPGLPGGSLNYAREDHVHPSDLSLYNTTLPLTTAQQVKARQNVYAAPFDALGWSGLQINGSFDVNQEGVSATATTKYFCDGWELFVSGAMSVGVATGNAPNLVPGLPNLAALSVSTAAASLAAGDHVAIAQYIEGYRIARLNWGYASAQPITLGFWSSHFRTGLYSGSIRNGASNRTYAFSYTQAASNVPQYNTVTIPGDIAGTWAGDNTKGMLITFAVATGATLTAPSANTWLGAAYHAAPGQINGVAATTDVFRLWGVVVLPGIEAPSAARSALIMRPYDQELLTCKRYWQRLSNLIVDANGPSQSTLFPVEMRAIPTVTGGGAGFINTAAYTGGSQFYQTSRAYQTLVLDARL